MEIAVVAFAAIGFLGLFRQLRVRARKKLLNRLLDLGLGT
jgi:hypothetical protein